MFVQSGVTPEVYEKLYGIAKDSQVVNYLPIDLVLNKGPGTIDLDALNARLLQEICAKGTKHRRKTAD